MGKSTKPRAAWYWLPILILAAGITLSISKAFHIDFHQPEFDAVFWQVAQAIIILVVSIIIAVFFYLTILMKRINAKTETTTIAQLPSQADRTWALLCNLTALCGYILPLLNIIAPLIIWLTQHEKSSFIDQHGREATNFQITMLIYYIIATVLTFVLVGYALLPLLTAFNVIMIIIACIKAVKGKTFRYPLSMRFIKV